MVGTNNTEKGRSQTVERAFKILEYLKEKNGATLDELTLEFGKAKSTLYRDITTLEYIRLVVKEENRYYPSLRFLDFAEYARNRIPGYSLIKEHVSGLASETEERVQFVAEEHGKGIYVYRSAGPHAVQTDPGIGKEIHLHTTAVGKAILAELPDQKVKGIIDHHGLPEITNNTITEKEELFEELASIQDQGYSINKQENVKGLHAVAVPIRESEESVIGGLSVSGPSHRMKGEWFEKELPDLLLGVSNELELNIKYS